MVLIRNEEFDPTSRRLPTNHPASLIANGILDAVCSGAGSLRDWESGQRAAGNPNFSGAVGLVSLLTLDNFCPNSSAPPPSLAPPIYSPNSACASFGTVTGYATYVNPFNGATVTTPTFSVTWDCTQNRGFPIGTPVKNETVGGFIDIAVLISRPVGAPFMQSLTAGVPIEYVDSAKFYVLESTFNPCPGCADAPIIPERPVIPTFPPEAPQIPRPEFPITINLPQLPGLPPLAIPIVYVPISPTLDLNLPLTFAPKFAPQFSFAPNIEINLGGMSITGGGYPEPIPDVEIIVEQGGGDCPDPCPDLDYDRIAEIVFDELDDKFPPSRPFTNEVILLAAAESRTFVLPEFTQWVELTIILPPPNRRSQFGGANGETVYYNGWYSFGVTGATSERFPIHYDFMSIPIPKGVQAFTYTIYVGGTASGRIGYQLPTPF